MKDLYKGYFINRINRFVVEIHLFSPAGNITRVYLPNPGRLWELFYKGSELILEKSASGSKYAYQIVAVMKDHKLVFLHTLRNNDLAEYLLKNRLIENLKNYRVLRREVKSPIGHSRFDFLLETEGEPCYLEVKSCSLFQGKTAMFPDAPSERASRHLTELMELREQGYRCAVLVIVQDDEAQYFLPEYHTDPLFALTFQKSRNILDFHIVGSKIKENMGFPERVQNLFIPWDILKQENQDRGSYMMILEIPEKQKLKIGALGELNFKPGYYVYCGSAMNGLTARVNRHLRKRKQMHWHLDYLRQAASKVKGLPIRSSENIECALAERLKRIAQEEISGFGSSDCHCKSHLFYFSEQPLSEKGFVEMLLYYRMEYPLEKSSNLLLV